MRPPSPSESLPPLMPDSTDFDKAAMDSPDTSDSRIDTATLRTTLQGMPTVYLASHFSTTAAHGQHDFESTTTNPAAPQPNLRGGAGPPDDQHSPNPQTPAAYCYSEPRTHDIISAAAATGFYWFPTVSTAVLLTTPNKSYFEYPRGTTTTLVQLRTRLQERGLENDHAASVRVREILEFRDAMGIPDPDLSAGRMVLVALPEEYGDDQGGSRPGWERKSEGESKCAARCARGGVVTTTTGLEERGDGMMQKRSLYADVHAWFHSWGGGGGGGGGGEEGVSPRPLEGIRVAPSSSPIIVLERGSTSSDPNTGHTNPDWQHGKGEGCETWSGSEVLDPKRSRCTYCEVPFKKEEQRYSITERGEGVTPSRGKHWSPSPLHGPSSLDSSQEGSEGSRSREGISSGPPIPYLRGGGRDSPPPSPSPSSTLHSQPSPFSTPVSSPTKSPSCLRKLSRTDHNERKCVRFSRSPIHLAPSPTQIGSYVEPISQSSKCGSARMKHSPRTETKAAAEHDEDSDEEHDSRSNHDLATRPGKKKKHGVPEPRRRRDDSSPIRLQDRPTRALEAPPRIWSGPDVPATSLCKTRAQAELRRTQEHMARVRDKLVRGKSTRGPNQEAKTKNTAAAGPSYHSLQDTVESPAISPTQHDARARSQPLSPISNASVDQDGNHTVLKEWRADTPPPGLTNEHKGKMP